MRRVQGESGQAAAELVATIPLVLGALLAAAQAAVAGYALWSAEEAARAGARASLVEGAPKAAAISALPGFLEGDAEIVVEDGVEVEVRAPALLPGLPGIRVGARADLRGPGLTEVAGGG